MDPNAIAEEEQEEVEFLLLLQKILDDQNKRREQADFEDDLLGSLAIIMLGIEEARRLQAQRRKEHRSYLTRPELLPNPRAGTPWQRLFESQNDRAFIVTTGFDFTTFTQILDAGFQELWDAAPIPRQDVNPLSVPRLTRRSLDAPGALGLILHFLNSTMTDTTLCEVFAIIPTTVSRYINFSMKILLVTLRKMKGSQISWPHHDQFQEYNDLILARHPRLDGAFGSMDGLNLPVQTSKDQEIENATYNGWLHEHFVSSVFAFASDGVIIACNLNAPGSWHDSRVARPIYEKLRIRTPDGYFLVTDTAFPRGTDQIAGKICAPIKEGTRLPANITDRKAVMEYDRQLLSYRQTAEWGMRTMQGTFGRLRIPLSITYNTLRADILEGTARLFNLRARNVGRNQTRTVYKDVWSEEETLWRTFDKMLFREQRENDRVGRFYLVEADE